MKKSFSLFALTALFSLIMMATSCSKSSDSEPPFVEKALVLTSNKTDIKEGEAVEFTVKENNELVAGATLFIDNVAISNPFIFQQAGTYTVIAKKEGYKNSNSITIKVNNGQATQKKLVLSAERTIFYEGETIKFTVKDNNNQQISDAVIKLDGKEVGSSWLAQKAGNYTFIATKEGYEASQPLPIDVRVSEVEIKSPSYFIYQDKRYDLSKASFKYIGQKVGDGGIYDQYRLELSNGINSFNNVLQFNVEFKRELLAFQVSPKNGNYTITPFEPFGLTTWSSTWLDVHTDEGSSVDLADMYKTATGNQYIELVKDGKIDFTLWTMDFKGKPKEKIIGKYTGEITIDTKK